MVTVAEQHGHPNQLCGQGDDEKAQGGWQTQPNGSALQKLHRGLGPEREGSRASDSPRSASSRRRAAASGVLPPWEAVCGGISDLGVSQHPDFRMTVGKS